MHMNSTYKKLGDRINKIRKSKTPKMNGEKLAELSGLSATTIYNLENGKLSEVKLDTIFRVAKALEVPVSVLVDDEVTIEAASLIELIRTKLEKPRKKTA